MRPRDPRRWSHAIEGRPEIGASSVSKRTVLVVDDHVAMRMTVRKLLEMEGYDVVGEVGDVASAVDAILRTVPDAVVLDVQLPDGTGFDVLKQISASGVSPRVVLVSSRDASDYGSAIPDSGAVGFLTKEHLSGPGLHALLHPEVIS
jgi:two-component system, chemotaxis family, chemotaxis protein CheY